MVDPREGYLAEIKDIAVNAGAILLRYFEGDDLHEGTKATVADIVTDADLASDSYIREQFSQRFPTFGVITEEGSMIPPKNPGPDELWLCADPLDGTIRRTSDAIGPEWCVQYGPDHTSTCDFGNKINLISQQVIHGSVTN
jgi:fructose-1,6-bisphosphatase/inositol monophosphatase family enzyme